MTRHLPLLSLLLASLAVRPALAQQRPAPIDLLATGYRHHGHRCCCRRRIPTERTNRTALLLRAGLTTDRAGQAYGGFGMELGRAVGPRLTVGVQDWLGISRASASSYDYQATRPALSYYSLAGSARYQLLNTRRWRLEALGGLGAGAIALEDRDQVVGSGRGQHVATVFFSVHPLVEAGVGLTYKLKGDTWLSSQLSYRLLPGTSGLGAPGEFSGWQASVGIAMPWGWHVR